MASTQLPAFSLERWTVAIIYGILPLSIVILHRIMQADDPRWKSNDKRMYHRFIPYCCLCAALCVIDRDLSQFVEDTFFIDTNMLMQCVIASWIAGLMVILAVAIGLLCGWSKMEKRTPKIQNESKQAKSQKKGTKKQKTIKRGKKSKSIDSGHSTTNSNTNSMANSKVKSESNMEMISSFLCAAGDELVMRCILLPELLAIYGENSFIQITSIIGMISAGQNIVYSWGSKETLKELTGASLMETAAGAIYLRSFFLCWLGWMSSYSFFVVTAGHFTFDRINKKFLGDMITKEQGLCKGYLWLINADGLAGCIGAGIYAGIMYLWIQFTR